MPAAVFGSAVDLLAGNHAFMTLTGLSAVDVGHWRLNDGFSGDADPERVAKAMDAARHQGYFAGEVLCATKQGATYWNDLIVQPLAPASNGESRTLAIFRDVTARRSAEIALGTGAAHDRLILDRIQAGIVIHAANTDMVYANSKAIELLGITYDAMLGALVTDPRWEFLGADGGPMPIADFPVSRVLTTKAAAHNMLVGIRRPSDQQVVWVLGNAYPVLSNSGSIREIVVSFTDVTGIVQAEQALQKSEERLRLVLAGSTDATWDWDRATNMLYYAPRWWQMLGYEVDELPNDAELWVRLMHPDDRAVVLPQLEAWLNGDASTYEIEFRLQHKQGHYVHVLSRGIISRDAGGQALRISGANTDITERLALEARLQQSQKMEAIGQLAGGVAHDFNNLLAVIVGNLELITAALPDDGELREELNEALNAALRGADLTRRLLTFSRQQPMHSAIVDVSAVLQSLSGLLPRLIDERIQVHVRLEHGLPPIRVDSSQLENALLNLSINARDAMPNGGTMTIVAEPRTILRDRHTEGAVLYAGTYVCVSVTDTGDGMAKEVLSRALDPFFTTKAVGKGTGLGLSMVYGFVTQSGGQLIINSTPSVGTRVEMYFPASEDLATADVGPAGDAPYRVDPRHEVVLVVEDDPNVRKLCLCTLHAIGYRTLEADCGPVALDIIARALRIDVLLTDVVMPLGMTGKDLATEALRLRPDLKVVYMSGYAANLFDDDASSPPPSVLAKPFTIAELAHAIAAVLEGSTAVS